MGGQLALGGGHPLAADLRQQIVDLTLAAVAVVVYPRVRERRVLEIVLAGLPQNGIAILSRSFSRLSWSAFPLSSTAGRRLSSARAASPTLRDPTLARVHS
jgi:hypothetical protein